MRLRCVAEEEDEPAMELYGVWCAGGSSAVMNSLTVGRSRLGVRARAWDRAASCVKAEGGGRLIASCLSNSAGDSPVHCLARRLGADE